jgi:predicted nucleic acid-binding protein
MGGSFKPESAIILDTSVLIEYERDRLDLDSFISGRENDYFGLSTVSVAELLHGVYHADTESRRSKRSEFVEKIIETFFIFPFDLKTSRVYAKLWANLLGKGIKIGAHDLIIGATALANDFSIATFNIRHFKRIEGLKLEILK